MVLRWAAAAFVETEKNFRRIIGHQELWALRAVLEEDEKWQEVMVAQVQKHRDRSGLSTKNGAYSERHRPDCPGKPYEGDRT